MQEKEIREKVYQYIIDWHDKWGKLLDISSLWIYWNQHYNPGMERGETISDEEMFIISETVMELIFAQVLTPKMGYHGFSTKEFQITRYSQLLERKAQLAKE